MKEDMKKKYYEMYHTHLVEGKDKVVMQIWGEKTNDFVCEIMEKYPDCANRYVRALETSIEAKNWNNYLSHHEMSQILDSLSPKARWKYEDVVAACKSCNVPIENKPYWNTCALVATMCMIDSDHHETLSAIVKETDEYVVLIYNLAVDKLQDPDRKCFVRDYFEDVIDY